MIEVLDAAPLATVQDLGRKGYRSIGVGCSGAIDPLALVVGNILIENDENAAGVEITLSPFRVRFTAEVRFALTGACCGATLDDLQIPPWWTMTASRGQILEVNHASTGVRAYLTVKGGIDAPVVLGSRSTDMKGAFGGLHAGRFLKRGDVIPVRQADPGEGAEKAPRAAPVAPVCCSQERCRVGFGIETPHEGLRGKAGSFAGVTAIRVVEAAEAALMTDESRLSFWGTPWVVTPESNRLGIRLRGPQLALGKRVELLSHGISPGIIQLPPGGQPIVQMCDANTTGGYPKIGVVIQADLWRLGQARIGAGIQFVKVGRDEAVRALVEMNAYIERCRHSVSMYRILGATW